MARSGFLLCRAALLWGRENSLEVVHGLTKLDEKKMRKPLRCGVKISSTNDKSRIARLTDQALDLGHVATEATLKLASPEIIDTFAPGLTVASVVVAGAAFWAGGKTIGNEGLDAKIAGVGLLSLGVESSLAAAASLASEHTAEKLEKVGLPFALVHGGADLALGAVNISHGLKEKRTAQIALGLAESVMGAGIIAGALTHNPAFQWLAIGGLAGKLLASNLRER